MKETYGTSSIASALGLQQGIGQTQQQAYNDTLAQTAGAYWSNAITATNIPNQYYNPVLGMLGAPHLAQQRQEPKRVAKTGKLLDDLRREIEDWHGDVLRAA